MHITELAHSATPRPDRPRPPRPKRTGTADAGPRLCLACHRTRAPEDFPADAVPGGRQRRDWCEACLAPLRALAEPTTIADHVRAMRGDHLKELAHAR